MSSRGGMKLECRIRMVVGQQGGGRQFFSAKFKTLKSCFMHISSLPKSMKSNQQAEKLLGTSLELLLCTALHFPLLVRAIATIQQYIMERSLLICTRFQAVLSLLLGTKGWLAWWE